MIRLSVMVLNVLNAINYDSFVDPWLFKSALLWLHSVQREDGSFSEHFNASTVGNSSVIASSFVLICLADVKHDDVVLYQLVSAIQRFLEQQIAIAVDVETIAPVAAALLVSHSHQWPAILERLDSVCSKLLDDYDSEEWLVATTYALTAYFHQNKPERYLNIVKQLVIAPWQTLESLV